MHDLVLVEMACALNDKGLLDTFFTLFVLLEEQQKQASLPNTFLKMLGSQYNKFLNIFKLWSFMTFDWCLSVKLDLFCINLDPDFFFGTYAAQLL